MSNLIITQPGKRGLTEAGKEAFKLAYESLNILESTIRPSIRFSRDAAEIFRQISELRKKEWRTTSRWNSEADYTGLLGEIAAQRYLGVTPEAAMTDFLNGLQGGDPGFDVQAAGLKLDVKSTKGQALKFKFSKTNRFSHLADGFIFAHVDDVGMEPWVHLLGWSHRAEIKPHQRDDDRSLFVRAETLRRAGVLKPIIQLKDAQTTLQAIH